jgi:hypothetical protein
VIPSLFPKRSVLWCKNPTRLQFRPARDAYSPLAAFDTLFQPSLYFKPAAAVNKNLTFVKFYDTAAALKRPAKGTFLNVS